MQFQRIVVGLDFTDASLAAARWVATFAPDAEILLAHVVKEARVPSFVRSQLPRTHEITASVAPQVYGGLRALADLIGSDRVRFDILAGDPPATLAQVADDEDADLVCLGRGRRRRGSARFGATTAQRLLSRGRVPALVVPALQRGMPTRVLTAVDERLGGEYVFEVGCGVGAAGEARVEVLHVIEPEVEAFVRTAREAVELTGHAHECDAWPRQGGSTTMDADRWLREQAREWVNATLNRTGLAARRVTAVIEAGDAGQEIIRHARRSSADLIVIGRGGDASHANAPAGALPLGSATRLVLWAAQCPVLVVPLGIHTGKVIARRGRSERNRLDAQVVESRTAV